MKYNANFKIKGEVIDVLINTKTGERKEFRGNNIIVEGLSKLIAALMKGQDGFSGILYWENGIGLPEWDSNPVDPSITDVSLVTPLYRKAINKADIIFIDENNEESIEMTNRLQISILFAENESNGQLRELGIWGGDATGALGSGVLINHRIHGVLTKTNEMILERKLRLSFELV